MLTFFFFFLSQNRERYHLWVWDKEVEKCRGNFSFQRSFQIREFFKGSAVDSDADSAVDETTSQVSYLIVYIEYIVKYIEFVSYHIYLYNAVMVGSK